MKKIIIICVVSGMFAACNTTSLADTPSRGSFGRTTATFDRWGMGSSFDSRKNIGASWDLNATEWITISFVSWKNLIDNQCGVHNLDSCVGSLTRTEYSFAESGVVNWNKNTFCGCGTVLWEGVSGDVVDGNGAELINYTDIIPEEVFWLRADAR